MKSRNEIHFLRSSSGGLVCPVRVAKPLFDSPHASLVSARDNFRDSSSGKVVGFGYDSQSKPDLAFLKAITFFYTSFDVPEYPSQF